MGRRDSRRRTQRKQNLKELPELLRSQARIPYDSTHGISVYRVVARNREYALPVCHDYVLAPPNDVEASSLKSLHGAQMGMPGILGRGQAGTSTSRI